MDAKEGLCTWGEGLELEWQVGELLGAKLMGVSKILVIKANHISMQYFKVSNLRGNIHDEQNIKNVNKGKICSFTILLHWSPPHLVLGTVVEMGLCSGGIFLGIADTIPLCAHSLGRDRVLGPALHRP